MKVSTRNSSCSSASGGGSSSLSFQDEGTALGTASVLNFVGDNVEASKVGDTVTVTVSVGEVTVTSPFRGLWDASTGSVPSNGSGTAGVVMAGDWWVASSDGVVEGTQIYQGYWIVATVNGASTLAQFSYKP